MRVANEVVNTIIDCPRAVTGLGAGIEQHFAQLFIPAKDFDAE
jgi:hypothetical protein